MQLQPEKNAQVRDVELTHFMKIRTYKVHVYPL